MDYFDFFFPEQAQAAHLRRLASRPTAVVRSSTDDGQAAEIQSLREDVNFLTLVIAALLRRSTETMSMADVQDLLTEIDGLDGVADGGLDTGVLRGILGVLKVQKEEEAKPDHPAFNIKTTPRYRNR